MSVLVDELTCKPLDHLSEVQLFSENLPSWRTLCVELQPHSEYLVKNSLVIGDNLKLSEFGPANFCHFNPDTDVVEDHVRQERMRLPKTLVCHDMANGYQDDSKIDGTGSYDAYTFYNWAGIDIFCYFSHHFITIPPLGWINVGHAHGVKVIGTLVTEWTEGQVMWDKILATDTQYKNFADSLVTIAKTLKFDGWLLNVETKVTKPKVLLEFVKYLHKTLHEELKHAVLIWYDSVTIEGSLNWQNVLNQRNKPFFDACDGIFTNYSWTQDQVRESAQLAGYRRTDVYIGIDVWGRNFFGGGQFNTHEAVNAAYSVGCSLAIFAPAWTHEAISMDPNDINAIIDAKTLDSYQHFLLRDRALWDCIWPYLNTKLPCNLPFKTSFCRGQGKKRRLYGEVLCPVPWYNLRHMQYQPNSLHGRHRYTLSVMSRRRSEARRKDKKGIIKYIEEKATTSKEEMELVTQSKRLITDSDVILETKSSTTDITEQGKHQSMKSKIKDVFRHIFKLKHKGEDENTHSEGNEVSTKENKVTYKKPLSRQVSIQIEDTDSLKSESSKKEKKKVSPRASRKSMTWTSININLRRSGHTPVTRYELAFEADERDCLEVYFEDSFIGGSCLKLNPCDKLVPFRRRTMRLFHCDFTCSDSLVFCVVTKSLFGCENQTLNIKLTIQNAIKENQEVNLVGRTIPTEDHDDQMSSAIVYLYPLNISDIAFTNMQKYLLLNEPDFYIPVENSYDWKVRYYKLHMPGSKVTTVYCCLGLEHGSILLGHFGVCPVETFTKESSTSTD